MPPIDPANPVVKLVSAGTRAEFEHRPDVARACYEQAWQAHTDDYEACIAAHYLARCQPTPEQALRWDLEALQRAQAAPAESVREFMPSLYLSLGGAYEKLGDLAAAHTCFDLAAGLGALHTPD